MLRSETGALDIEQIETVDVRTWVEWLHARVSPADSLTGDVLIGSGNPTAVFREVLPQLSTTAQSRFGEALLATIRTARQAIDASDDDQERLHGSRLLIAASDLLASLPIAVIREMGDIHGALDVLYDTLRRLDELPVANVLRERLRGAALRTIAMRNPEVLSDEELTSLLHRVSTASGALRLLREREPELSTYWMSQFVAASLATDNADIIEPEIRRYGQDGEEALSRQRQIFLDVLPFLDAQHRTSFMELPVAQELLRSPTIDQLKRRRKFTASWKGPRIGSTPPEWINALFDAIQQVAETVTGTHLVFNEAKRSVSWYDQAVSPKYARTLPKDPIIASRSRTETVDIVPYAYVRTFLAVVATKSGASGGIAKQASTWKTIGDAIKSGSRISVITRTAATDELTDYLQDQDLTVDPDAETENFSALIDDLVENHTTTVLLADEYFWETLKEISQESFTLKRDNLKLKVSKLHYRSPALVGIPIRKQDLLWGRIVRDVVDEVLYGKYQFLQNPDIQDELKRMGFEVLTPEAYENESFWEPPIPELVPRAVADPKSFQRARATRDRSAAVVANNGA